MGARAFLLLSIAVTCTVVLVTYLAVVAIGWRTLERPDSYLVGSTATVAFAAIALLALDAFLPVPSSIVMVAIGAAFPLPLAIVIAFVGRLLMSAACFLVGRGAASRGADRAMTEEGKQQASDLVNRHGALAILLSRPVPILGETVLFVAGLSGMRALPAFCAAVAAAAAEAVAYVSLGHMASGFYAAAALWTFGVGVGLATLIWLRSRSGTVRNAGGLARSTPRWR